MLCPTCGSQNPDGAKFCSECGASTAGQCPQCGHGNMSQAKFCNECGASLNIGEKKSEHLATAHEAERRRLSVMFCDLVGPTELSRALDPEDYRALITTFQEACSASVRHYDGHVAKYLGDGFLVYFGYPQVNEDDAERAVLAGLESVAAVRALDVGADLHARVGIASGLAVVGDIAGDNVSEAGAISGDTPNLAARLEAIAQPDEVVVGERT